MNSAIKSHTLTLENLTAHGQLLFPPPLPTYSTPPLPHTPFCARQQHLPVRSTFRFNLNKFQLDFPTICSHFVAHFFPFLSISLILLHFFSTFGNIYGQKVLFARLVACWSCCCWFCCFYHFPQFFDAAFSLCVPSSVSRVRQLLSVSVRSIGGHVRAGTALGHYYTSTSRVGGGEAAAVWVVWQPGGRHVKL